MFDYLAYLRNVTGDESWRRDDLRFINDGHQEAHFRANSDEVTFTLDGQTIYIGPIKLDYPDYIIG
jgi:hypothetical protein